MESSAYTGETRKRAARVSAIIIYVRPTLRATELSRRRQISPLNRGRVINQRRAVRIDIAITHDRPTSFSRLILSFKRYIFFIKRRVSLNTDVFCNIKCIINFTTVIETHVYKRRKNIDDRSD